MSRHLTNKKGFTMIELIVSMAIFAMVTLTVLSMLNISTISYRDSVRENYGKMLAQNVQTYVVETVRYATAVTIVDRDVPNAADNLHTEEGQLYRGSSPVFDDTLYKNRTVTLEFTKEGDTLLGIAVIIGSTDAPDYYLDTVVNLPNLPLNAITTSQVIKVDGSQPGQSLSILLPVNP